MNVIAISASLNSSMAMVRGSAPSIPEGTYRQMSVSTNIDGCPGARLTVKVREPGVIVVTTSGGGQGVARYNADQNAYVGQFKWPADGATRNSDIVVATAMFLQNGVLTVSARSRALDFAAQYRQ